MKNLLLVLVSLLSLTSYAQLSAVDYKSKEFAAFKASKTYVVLSGDKKFDKEIQSAIKDLWKITPTDFIDTKTFDSKISDPSASFMLLLSIGATKSDPNTMSSYTQTYHYLALINGGKKKLSTYGYSDMIAYCPINFYQNGMKLVNCSYRIRNMVEGMIQTMEIVQKNDIKGNSKKIAEGLKDYYNGKASKIKERTLLINTESIGQKLTKADIAAIYPYKFEMCNTAKIEQVIKEKNTNYYYFQPAVTLNRSMFVINPATGDVLYFNYKVGGLNIKKDNIEDLVKIMKKKKKK